MCAITSACNAWLSAPARASKRPFRRYWGRYRRHLPAYVILRRTESDDVALPSVRGKETCFFTGHELLNDHRSARIAKGSPSDVKGPPPNMSSIAASASAACFSDDHALARSQAVGLYHIRRPEIRKGGQCCCFAHCVGLYPAVGIPAAAHMSFVKPFGSFKLRRALGQDRIPALLRRVAHRPIHATSGRFRSNNDQSDIVARRKRRSPPNDWLYPDRRARASSAMPGLPGAANNVSQ